MSVNLGNVAGVVRSADTPKEADGTTVKTYVLWAQPIGPHVNGIATGGEYNLFYYDYQTDTWVSLAARTNIAYGRFQIFKGNTNTADTLEVNDIIVGWWDSTTFIRAMYTNALADDDTANINNYTVLSEDLPFS